MSLESSASHPTSNGAGFDPDAHAAPVSRGERKAMMEDIREILLLDSNPDEEMVSSDEDDSEAKLEKQLTKNERLGKAKDILARLWRVDDEAVDIVAEKLADKSRDPKWRIPLGDTGILDFFLLILSNSRDLRHTLKVHALRLIGNSCADTDENRARVVASDCFPSIIAQLKNASLLAFAIPVLYNICVDYVPAQKQASEMMLSQEIFDLISSSRIDESRVFIGYISFEPGVAPQNAAIILFETALYRESPVDLEDFVALANTAVAYLKHEKFQRAIVTEGALRVAIDVLLHSYTRFDSQSGEGEAVSLSQMRISLNQALSDISALSEFKDAVSVSSSFSSDLRQWLSSPQSQLQICACIMLGNLARSDATCEEFVHTCKVQQPIIAVLTSADDSQLLHAALGFIKNLALPRSNKLILGDAGLLDVLPRLWELDTLQQIQFTSISLTRQLVIGTPQNVRRICCGLSTDDVPPASSRTRISLLIALFERTDVEPIKMEISRLITALCRVYNAVEGSPDCTLEELQRERENFFERHPDLGRPLSFMVSQTKWPVLRSEGWFVFALMARTPEGARCINSLMHDDNAFGPLVTLLTGRNVVDYEPARSSSVSSMDDMAASLGSSHLAAQDISIESKSPDSVPNTTPDMTGIDRENALVMVSELLKNMGDQMAIGRKTLFEDILKEGSGLLISNKQKIVKIEEEPS